MLYLKTFHPSALWNFHEEDGEVTGVGDEERPRVAALWSFT